MGDSMFVGGGATSPKEARLASAGLLAVQGPTLLDARTGVFVGPGSTALVTGTADTGPMTVTIAAHVPITSRGRANGPYVGPVPEAVTKVTIGAAPGTNSRIDIVYERQADATTDVSPDGTTAPVYGVLPGQAGAIPAKPDLSTIVGAEELATVRVAAGATSTNGANVTITNTAKQTVARGARVPVRNQAEWDALTPYPSLEVYRLDTGRVHLCTAAPAGQAATWVTVYPAMEDWVIPTLANGWQGDALTGSGYESFAWRIEGPRVVTRGWLRTTTAQNVAGALITTSALPLPTGAHALYPERDNAIKPTRVTIFPTGADAGKLTNGTPLAAETYLYFGGLSYPRF